MAQFGLDVASLGFLAERRARREWRRNNIICEVSEVLLGGAALTRLVSIKHRGKRAWKIEFWDQYSGVVRWTSAYLSAVIIASQLESVKPLLLAHIVSDEIEATVFREIYLDEQGR